METELWSTNDGTRSDKAVSIAQRTIKTTISTYKIQSGGIVFVARDNSDRVSARLISEILTSPPALAVESRMNGVARCAHRVASSEKLATSSFLRNRIITPTAILQYVGHLSMHGIFPWLLVNLITLALQSRNNGA